MQLNNLVIIPILHPTPCDLFNIDSQSSPVYKGQNLPKSLMDDIAWKKSVSAFKKFKGKKDKETKSTKITTPNIVFVEQEKQDLTLNTKFTLVDNDINFSLLSSQDYDLMKFEDPFDYFDPNTAPFFENGITYQYFPKEGKVQPLEEQHEALKLTKKSSTAVKLKKQLSKREKMRQQNPNKDILVKTQKSYSSQVLLPNYIEQPQDPFIIIKAPEKRGQTSEMLIKTQRQPSQELKRTKMIKKKSIFSSRPSSVYSREINSRQRSEDLNDQSESGSSDEKSIGYGNDELPMIEFDFGRTLNHLNCEEDQNGTDNLPIYETKQNTQSQLFARIKPFQNSTEILQEYQFKPEFSDQNNVFRSKAQNPRNSAQSPQKS